MPNEIFISNTDKVSEDESDVSVDESSIIAALKVEDDTEVMEKMNELKEKITDVDASTEEKNTAFEELKLMNKNSSKEETLETKIKEMCNCDNFVKIDGDNVRVVLNSDDSSVTSANNIMRLVQDEFSEKMYISVKFN